MTVDRLQSKFNKDVQFELWQCALTGKHPLFFVGMMEIYDIRFFLQGDEGFYVVTIPRRSPFRLVDETCLGALSDLLVEEDKEPPLPNRHVWMTKTWKVWGTPFLKELNKEGLLFLHRPNKEDHFQYLIWTEDESPEFISPEPEIKVYPFEKRHEIIEQCFQNDFEKRKQEGFG